MRPPEGIAFAPGEERAMQPIILEFQYLPEEMRDARRIARRRLLRARGQAELLARATVIFFVVAAIFYGLARVYAVTWRDWLTWILTAWAVVFVLILNSRRQQRKILRSRGTLESVFTARISDEGLIWARPFVRIE